MKKLRKRIFAAVLAAFMIVTAMPATALYASAETGSVSGNAAGQAGTDDTEETGDGDTEETETDDAEETGDSDTEEPAQEPPAGPSEEDTAECICETLCTEDNGSNSGCINGDCPVCGAEGADLSACKGKEQGSAPEKDTADDNAGTDRLECICETLCTEDNGSNSGRINGDCPVCGAEDADLSRCKGEKTKEQEKTGEKVITAWEWIDPEEYLTDGILALPGASRENPAFVEDVTALLPEKIQTKVAAVNAAEDGEETEEDAETAPEIEDAEITLTGWKCASYPEDGAYEGTYTFTAFLPEGFVLAEDAAALEVEVELGGGEMLLRGGESAVYQKAAWDESKREVVCTEETADSCTSVENSAAAVTWYNGWYVVNGNVTISEPITVSGEVNLILVDGCTLTAEKGIVVTTDNSLTIYAQSGGTGTLNATGGDGAGIGGDGKTNANVDGGSSGAITIHGGNITATSENGAGIGGGAPWSGANGGSGSNITIYGGRVTAQSTGTMGGAGIGGGGGDKGGGTGENIKIYGGTVNAIGSTMGAGVGGGGAGIGGTSGDGTNITVSGGTVTAIGGKYAAGIGGGGGYYYSNNYGSGGCTGGTGSVTISGGIVDASSPTEVAYANYKGDPIGNGGNAGDTAATVSKTTGIVFENGAGTVCGAVTLDGSYNVPGDYMLNIPAGASLSGSGTLSGGSAFTTENLRLDMIAVPTDLYYTGADRSEDITTRLSGELDKGVTICGQTFAVSGWTLAVAKTDDLTYTATYTNNKGNTNTFTQTITLLKSGTKFEGDVKTYNGDTQTTTFNADDTITVKATPTATGTAPAKAATRLRGGYTAPTAGQMALFVGDVQVSAPVEAGTDGTYTMEVSAAEVLLQGNAEQNGNAITLTAKFVGNDNMADAAGTVDVRISAVAMAERDGTVIGYFGVSNFEGTNNLFFQNDYANATITLLEDVQPSTNSETGTTCSTMVNITCTLDLAGHNFASTDTAIYVLPGGNLTIQDSSTGKTGTVSFIKSDGTLTLYGGTFGKIETAYTLASLLAENCAYYKGSTPIRLSELANQKELTDPVTVQECQHKDVTPTANNDGTHTLSCPYCGYTKTAEDCDYGEYIHNDTSHTRICKLCGYQNVEAHNIKCTAEASGTVIAVSEACKTCGYGKDLGTVTIHIPKLVYGDLTGVITAETTLTGTVVVAVWVDNNPSGDTVIFPFDPPTMATLTGNALLSAGEHKIKINIVIIRDENALAECELTFDVDPASLTADMVTLGQTDVTYNGTEQKPTLSVKQGQTALTEGMDYEVSYTRDGVVTTDFINAGTVKITVTGKGNYEGEVEKTFTIRQAESDVGTVTAETLENTLDVSQVVLSRTNQTPAGTLTLTDSTLKYGTNTYTWKFTPDDTVNYKAATGTVQVTVNDTIAPSAEYQLGTDGWKKFVNTVTFGLFCKDFKTVDIRSTDDTDAVTGSGIASTQYYISNQEITDTDSIVWETYTESISLDALGKYFIYVKVTDNAGNTAVLNSEGIVVYAESTVSPAVFDYTYKENRDCTVQLAMNGNTFKGFTDREGNAVGINDYTIDGDGRLILKAAYLDTLDQGEYAYTVSVKPQGIETDQVTLAYTFTVNVKARELTVTGAAAAGRAYDGTNKVEITAVTLSGIAGSDTVAVDVSGIQGALSSANAGTYTSVTLPQLTLTGADSGNYTLVQPQTAVPASVEITPLDAEITVGTAAYSKTFGDGAFTLDVTDNNPEAAVQYEVTEGADVVSVENGTVTIHAAGSATITATLPQSANYNAAESKAVTVAKKSGYTVDGLNRSYLYSRENTDSIDLAALLPKDCGTVTYGTPAVSGDVAYSTVPAVTDGKLSYTQRTGSVDAEGSITVTVTTQNYADITITVNVKLIDRIPVRLKEGTQVTLANNVLAYGEPLSKLAFNEAEFVTADGKTVAGTLAWKEADAVPDAGTASAAWVFTPNDPAVYETVEGTAAITVNKAQPVVSAAPTVADRVYDPSVTLDGGDLSSATVTGVDGSTLEGTWSWQGAGIVPTVNNNGYVAVFTPRNTTNYETVSRTITVNVAKATPYIAVLPTAAGITYGDALGASALTGGTVQYGNGAGQAGDNAGSTAAVTGTFTWQEPSAKPVAADSNVTEYTVVFMPSDTANYHPVEAKATLTINKAQNAPNMPGSAMDVSNSLEKVKDVPLPEGWEWQASDQDTALEVGVAVNAVAVYAGADHGNYEKETVTVSITRSACDHAAGDILYTGAGEKAPTCTESGLGHRECAKCGSVVESGIVVKALEHTGGTATCSQRAVCTRCNQPYGDLDSGRHGDTEVRGFTAATCTAGGYTGDTYCKDCGAKTKTGNATPALGHNYTSTVTKEPTTGSEGIRTYTCTRCGHSYTESIPKLPEETHHHSYFGSVTKQPTCTDTGIRTYTCSCGDSYTETMAALGHHYQSSVTKQPTATAEGVMTYTCIRCGHSYTRPITKLPGEGATDPGTSQPGDTEPGSGSTETRPDTGTPFLKGGDGKTGWDVIRAEEEQAQEGSTINVDMNGSVVVPGDIFVRLRGKDITITFDMGNGIIWSVDGKSITGDVSSPDKAGDIDFSVQTGVNTVPVDIVNNVTGERYSIQISLAHEGEFGFTAVLSIGLGKENAGYTASLYYYNESTGELEFICKDQVAEDGTVSLAFTHASDYVIAIDGDGEESGSTTEPEQPDTPDKDSTGEAESPKTGQAWRPWWFIVVGALVIVMGIGVFLAVRKKQETENS